MDALKDASHLYEVERRAEHAARPGFRITELQISPVQKVPWHLHTNVQDTFYVIDGRLRLFLREPKEEVRLEPGETYSVQPGRPPTSADDRPQSGGAAGAARTSAGRPCRTTGEHTDAHGTRTDHCATFTRAGNAARHRCDL